MLTLVLVMAALEGGGKGGEYGGPGGNVVSFPNPLALEAENLSSGNGGVLVDPGAISQGKQALSAVKSSP